MFLRIALYPFQLTLEIFAVEIDGSLEF